MDPWHPQIKKWQARCHCIQSSHHHSLWTKRTLNQYPPWQRKHSTPQHSFKSFTWTWGTEVKWLEENKSSQFAVKVSYALMTLAFHCYWKIHHLTPHHQTHHLQIHPPLLHQEHHLHHSEDQPPGPDGAPFADDTQGSKDQNLDQDLASTVASRVAHSPLASNAHSLEEGYICQPHLWFFSWSWTIAQEESLGSQPVLASQTKQKDLNPKGLHMQFHHAMIDVIINKHKWIINDLRVMVVIILGQSNFFSV